MATANSDTRHGPVRLTWIVVLIALSVLLNYVDRGAIGVAAPLMKEELKLSATGFGFAVSAFFWVYAPACLFVGWLCDRFCVYRVFAIGVAIWAISTAPTGFVGGLASLILLLPGKAMLSPRPRNRRSRISDASPPTKPVSAVLIAQIATPIAKTR